MQTVNVEEYYGLVRYWAQKVHGSLPEEVKKRAGVELRVFIQEGFAGLMEAKERYNSEKGASFATFASRRIVGAIMDYLRKLDPLTQGEREKVKELEEAKEKLIAYWRREPSVGELAQELGVTEEEVRKREALRITILSLEALSEPDEEGAGPTLWDVPSDDPDPEKKLLIKKLASDVNDCLETALDDVERRVLILRVVDELPLQVVGQIFSISSAETVRRREMAAKRKMKLCLESKDWVVTDIIQMLP